MQALSQTPHSPAMSDLMVFTRCVRQFTGRDLPQNPSDSNLQDLRDDVINARKSGANACVDLLHLARLNPVGHAREGKLEIENNGTPNALARDILWTINNFHVTWFPNVDFQVLVPDDRGPTNPSLVDAHEAAMHVTRALLQPNVSYAELVIGTHVLEAQRTQGSNPTVMPLRYQTTIANTEYYNAAGQHIFYHPIPVQTGELFGITPMSFNQGKWDLNVFPGTFPDSTTFYNRPIYANAGILGTQSYVLLNYGRQLREVADGGRTMGRRLSKAIFNDLLCKDAPPVRQVDALPFVNGSSTLSFRNGVTCMQCHSAYDPMAQVFRNLAYNVTHDYEGNVDQFMFMGKYNVTQSAETGAVDLDGQFFRRPPNGKLFFRSYDGSIKNISVVSPAGLGSALANVNDLYVCAAKRWYEFLTGISVITADVGDQDLNIQLTSEDTYYRNKVLGFGEALAADSTHNMMHMIEQMLLSPIYSSAGLRDL